ncbi:hypothetical protein M5K25_016972 [Dendrobium thyrsiflorum]|uniref:Uncharacterized protein n=1 Tax=Dendrobium thyrsiflorum TaxID=117978 RepID=A0ABD0USX8_DENTH
MVGEWMMDSIKIPWFHRSGPSWSLVYLVRGGSGPNLTEESLLVAMGCTVQGNLVDLGDHTGSGHECNLVMPFRSKSLVQRAPVITVFLRCYLAAKPSVRVHLPRPCWQETVSE